MSFHVHFTDKDRDYLDSLSLSPEAMRQVKEFIRLGIADIDDKDRTDPEIRPYPNEPFFRKDFFLIDYWGDDNWHRLDFLVDDTHAAMGILLVVFIDHTSGPWDFTSHSEYPDADPNDNSPD